MGTAGQTPNGIQLAILGKSSTLSEDDSISQSGCVKAKMCETTPFVNTVGAQYVASRAQIEQACDSLRHQGKSMVTKIGLFQGDVCADTTESPCTIAEALLVPEAATWSTMIMHTHPFSDDLLCTSIS